ncbi:MAG: SDR family NAD(P)-dependent oxidoreductase [Sedimentisphaeraceae bacterium JB056]
MRTNLTGSVAIVTGASRGIGKEIALMLGKLNATVVLAARSIEALENVKNEITDAGGKATTATVELTSEQSIIELQNSVKKQFGKCDILINNAGITYSGKLQDTPTDVYDNVMSINARGPFLMCREFLPLLLESPRAFIVNVSSVVGVKGYPLQSAYTASKHAVRGMTQSLAEELRDTNVRVHSICMGGVDTEMVTAVRPDINQDELIGASEIADAVEYLLTRDGNGVIDEIRLRRQTSSPWF